MDQVLPRRGDTLPLPFEDAPQIGNDEAANHYVTLPFHKNGEPAVVAVTVGVVPDLVTNVTVLEPLVLYLPLAQVDADTSRTLVVRASDDVESARAEAVRAIRELNPSILLQPIQTVVSV